MFGRLALSVRHSHSCRPAQYHAAHPEGLLPVINTSAAARTQMKSRGWDELQGVLVMTPAHGRLPRFSHGASGAAPLGAGRSLQRRPAPFRGVKMVNI